MCQQKVSEISNNNNNNNLKMKTNYSIKRVLRTLFKKHQKQQQQQQQQNNKIANSLESLEYEDNLRNAQVEEVYYVEIDENIANEKLAELVKAEAQAEEDDIYVPVRFARTAAGTFFWTTNLQPVSSVLMPAVDEDLVQPAFCYSSQQYPYMQYQDRWVQA